MASYTVYDEGKPLHTGDAKQILEEIRAENSQENKEIAQMDVYQYARALIDDAPYFLPGDLLEALNTQKFESEYDQALTYLSQMPTSGVRILMRS